MFNLLFVQPQQRHLGVVGFRLKSCLQAKNGFSKYFANTQKFLVQFSGF